MPLEGTIEHDVASRVCQKRVVSITFIVLTALHSSLEVLSHKLKSQGSRLLTLSSNERPFHPQSRPLWYKLLTAA